MLLRQGTYGKILPPPNFSIFRMTKKKKKSLSLKIVFLFHFKWQTFGFIHLSGRPQFIKELPLSLSHPPVYLWDVIKYHSLFQNFLSNVIVELLYYYFLLTWFLKISHLKLASLILSMGNYSTTEWIPLRNANIICFLISRVLSFSIASFPPQLLPSHWFSTCHLSKET